MQKEDLIVIAQLLHTMRDLVGELEKYQNKKKVEKFLETKKEILALQSKINEII